jgi:anti-sigma B factor antagonist
METFLQERDGDILVVAADGGLNRDTAHQLVDRVAAEVRNGARAIVVDCSRLEVISSAGIGVLLMLHKAMKAQGAEVRLAGLRGLVVQALRLARLDGIFQIFADVSAAKLAFRPGS